MNCDDEKLNEALNGLKSLGSRISGDIDRFLRALALAGDHMETGEFKRLLRDEEIGDLTASLGSSSHNIDIILRRLDQHMVEKSGG